MQIEIRVLHEGKTFEGRTDLLEVGGSRPRKIEINSLPVRKNSGPTKPGGAVDTLYQKCFFGEERTLLDVRGQLKKDGYNFGASSVLMALGSKEYLQRHGSRGSYSFVQKYPPPAS